MIAPLRLLKTLLLSLLPVAAAAQVGEARNYANQYDLAKEEELARRAADWRNGAVVYQVLPDRFVPPADLEAKRSLYPAPKKLHPWTEVPRKGVFVESVNVWSHEIDFWGGDLKSARTKVDYLKEIGVDVLYLNPIHMAYTNHKYDAQDYFEVSPEIGTRQDVKDLAADLHKRGMRLVLDGVFNHMGRTSPAFQEALKDPNSPWREWFYIGPEYKLGYRAWVNVPNLPEVNLENPRVRARLWGDPDSVVQGYLREGVDGWRLDVGFDIGFTALSELTRAAHTAKPGSVVIGEIWNYPEQWSPAVDGVMNMTTRELILQMVKGNVPAEVAGRQLDVLIEDYGLLPMLKSWIILDNHDTPRLKNALPEPWQQRMAQLLQFTVPGSPCVYYGVEVGMEGGDDPEQRGPMRWDLAKEDNEQFRFMKQLLRFRRESRALRIGDFRLLPSDKTLAFLRQTDRVEETVLVVANPTDAEVKEFLVVRDSKIMSYADLKDPFTGAQAKTMAGTLTVTVPPRTVHVFQTLIDRKTKEYSPFKRVK